MSLERLIIERVESNNAQNDVVDANRALDRMMNVNASLRNRVMNLERVNEHLQQHANHLMQSHFDPECTICHSKYTRTRELRRVVCTTCFSVSKSVLEYYDYQGRLVCFTCFINHAYA